MTNLFGWWKESSPAARRSLAAASLGWMLDSFDVMLYAMVLAALMRDLHMVKSTAGMLGSLTLLASAAGGMVFGVVADRFGRTRALRASILIYSVFTAACGLARTVPMLAVFRIFLGLGMGGEWASGAALVSETWPAEHRGKALGFMQSFWAVGYASAALVTAIILPRWGWRAVFFVGVLPALFTFWVRAKVEEPEIWETQRGLKTRAGLEAGRPRLSGRLIRITAAVVLMNAFTMFAWWGLQSLDPGISLPPPQSGRDRPQPRPHVGPRHLHAGRDVAGLSHVRVHQRHGGKEEDIRRFRAGRGRLRSALFRRSTLPSSCSSSARSSPSSGRDTSPGSAL